MHSAFGQNTFCLHYEELKKKRLIFINQYRINLKSLIKKRKKKKKHVALFI